MRSTVIMLAVSATTIFVALPSSTAESKEAESKETASLYLCVATGSSRDIPFLKSKPREMIQIYIRPQYRFDVKTPLSQDEENWMRISGRTDQASQDQFVLRYKFEWSYQDKEGQLKTQRVDNILWVRMDRSKPKAKEIGYLGFMIPFHLSIKPDYPAPVTKKTDKS